MPTNSPKDYPEAGSLSFDYTGPAVRYIEEPSIAVRSTWYGLGFEEDVAVTDPTSTLEKIRGCHVEIIMKDVSTVRYEPQRLWEWSRIAMELAEEFAP